MAELFVEIARKEMPTDPEHALKVARDYNKSVRPNLICVGVSCTHADPCHHCSNLASLILHERREAKVETLTKVLRLRVVNVSEAKVYVPVSDIESEIERLEKAKEEG